jgi:hypothetical protein
MQQENTTQIVTVEQLSTEGFTPAQIARLERLRACYPLIELVDEAQWQQLQFLGWLYRQGQYPTG